MAQSKYDVKFVISRVTGEGEQSSAEIVVDKAANLKNHVFDAYAVMDERCYQRNMSLLNSMKFMKTLPAEAQYGVKLCMDILYGKSSLPPLNDTEKQVVEAEQAVEEEPQ